MGETTGKRVDSVSRLIEASPRDLYQAYMDPEKLVAWLPPEGMKGPIEAFEPREGGAFRMILTYEQPGDSAPGKSSQDSDVVNGRFVELIPDRLIVQQFEFESEDPAFAGTMKMTWELKPVGEGTEVKVSAEDVPAGIRQEDHEAGMGSTLANLAAFAEKKGRREKPPFGDQILNDGLDVALEWGPNLAKPYGPRLAERQPQLTQAQLGEVEKICPGAMDFGHNLIYEIARKSDQAKSEEFEPTMKARYPWISAKHLSLIRSQGMYYAWKDGVG